MPTHLLPADFEEDNVTVNMHHAACGTMTEVDQMVSLDEEPDCSTCQTIKSAYQQGWYQGQEYDYSQGWEEAWTKAWEKAWREAWEKAWDKARSSNSRHRSNPRRTQGAKDISQDPQPEQSNSVQHN